MTRPPCAVLYEDNHLLVVVKPRMVPVQGDSSGDDDLLNMLKRYIQEAYNKPGPAYLGLVHRLDRPVGGVMAFARTSKAAARLSKQLLERTMQKEYLVIAHAGALRIGMPVELCDYLYKDPRSGNVLVYDSPTGRAKQARLSLTPLMESDGLSLLSVRLETGRPHQIRAQLAAHGMPLWGDQRYNGEASAGQPVALWSRRLTLAHPTLGRAMAFDAPPPDEYPWNLFLKEGEGLF